MLERKVGIESKFKRSHSGIRMDEVETLDLVDDGSEVKMQSLIRWNLLPF